MTVLVDLGNTRLKWAILRADGSLGPMRAVACDGCSISSLRAGMPVLAVSVAKESVRARFAAFVRKSTGFEPKFVTSEPSHDGLVNGYREAWRLGADRWVGLIGARACFPRARALLVVDVGTATTIDLLACDDRHRGGLILPGPSMMVESLLGKTGGIAMRAKDNRRSQARRFFARDTRAAIEQGAVQSVAAAIDRAWREARASIGVSPKLLLTGGGAAAIENELRAPFLRIDDLVLRGLVQYLKK